MSEGTGDLVVDGTEPITAAAPSPPVSQRRLVIGLCTTVVGMAFETIAVATAMPVAAREVGGLAYYAWAFSAFLIGMLFATAVAGRLADERGPAGPVLVGLAIFVVGLVVSGTATTMPQLVAGRLVQGLGSGAFNVAALVCVARAFAPNQRPRVFSYISAAWVVPSFVGPPVAAWLTRALSWHWVFFAVIPLAVFGGAMLLPTMRRMIRTHEPGPRSQLKPVPLWAAGVVALAAAMLQWAGQRRDWPSLIMLAAGLTVLVLALPRLMPPRFLRLGRGLPQVVTARGLLAGAFVGGEAFVPLMLVEQRQISLLLAGAVLTVGSIGWTTGSWLQSRPWLRLRRDRLITLGCCSVAFGLAVIALTASLPWLGYGVVAGGWVFCGLGMGLATSSTSLAVMALSAPADQGRNASSLNLSDALGSTLLVGAAGSIFAALHPGGNLRLTFGLVEASMCLVVTLAALASLRIGAVRNEFSR